MRPKKTRWIKCAPCECCFRPQGPSVKELEGLTLTLDELEALRLCDLEGYEQARIAKTMRVHRSTVSRILSSARKKVADALVNVKAIKIEGGCCEIVKANSKKRG